MRVLVTGGAGFVGRATVRALVEAELTGLHPWRFLLSRGAVRRLARVNDLVGGRLGALPDSGSIDWLLDNAPAVDTTRATTELGLAFRPLRHTVADTIRWWAQHDSIDRRQVGKLAPKPV